MPLLVGSGPFTIAGTPLQMPAVPAAPQTVEWMMNTVAAKSISPFTGQQQIQDWQADWLEATLSYPPMDHKTAQAWFAFLMKCRGPVATFLFGDPLAADPQGTADGTPLVDGTAQTGFRLHTKGWTPNAVGVLLPGDWLQVGSRMYRAVTQVDANGTGNAVINIYPRLRESPGDNNDIILHNTQGAFRLKSNVQKVSVSEMRFYGLQLEIVEVLC